MRLQHVVAVGDGLAIHHVVDVIVALKQLDAIDLRNRTLQRFRAFPRCASEGRRNHAHESERQLALPLLPLKKLRRFLRTPGNSRGGQPGAIQVRHQRHGIFAERIFRLRRKLSRDAGQPGSFTRPVGFPDASRSIHGILHAANPMASMPGVFRNPQHRENCRYTGLFGAAWSSSWRVSGVGLSAN